MEGTTTKPPPPITERETTSSTPPPTTRRRRQRSSPRPSSYRRTPEAIVKRKVLTRREMLGQRRTGTGRVVTRRGAGFRDQSGTQTDAKMSPSKNPPITSDPPVFLSPAAFPSPDHAPPSLSPYGSGIRPHSPRVSPRRSLLPSSSAYSNASPGSDRTWGSGAKVRIPRRSLQFNEEGDSRCPIALSDLADSDSDQDAYNHQIAEKIARRLNQEDGIQKGSKRAIRRIVIVHEEDEEEEGKRERHLVTGKSRKSRRKPTSPPQPKKPARSRPENVVALDEIDPEATQGRRPRRHRIPPLKYWAGERVIYTERKTATDLPEIAGVVVTSPLSFKRGV